MATKTLNQAGGNAASAERHHDLALRACQDISELTTAAREQVHSPAPGPTVLLALLLRIQEIVDAQMDVLDPDLTDKPLEDVAAIINGEVPHG